MCDIRLSAEQHHGIGEVVARAGYHPGTPDYLVMRARLAATVLLATTYDVLWNGEPKAWPAFLWSFRRALNDESQSRPGAAPLHGVLA